MPEKSLVVQPSELDTIYRSGKVSPNVQNTFKRSLDKGLSTEGMTIDQYIETNRRLKMEMKNYLDVYKSQRSTMESVIHFLKNPDLAGVRFVDKLGGIFGKNLQLEAKKIAKDPQAIRKLFEEMALSIEQSRGKTRELEKQAIALYNASLTQRENIEKDITDLLQKISVNKDRTIKLEDEYEKVQETMNKLLNFMEGLGVQIKGGRPIFEGISSSSSTKIDDTNPNISYEERLDQLVNKDVDKENGETTTEPKIGAEPKVEIDPKIGTEPKVETTVPEEKTKDLRIKEKKIIEAIQVYHSINNQLVDAENFLRDARNEKLVLHQNYERAKENLTLYERVLINQVDEARNYFAMLFAIYDAEGKYTIPSARLIAHLASLQEVTVQLAQQIYYSRSIFNSLLDNVTAGALEIQNGIQNLALNPSWDPVMLDQAESRTLELAKRTKEFSNEMDKRLIQIETIYRSPELQDKIRVRTIKGSGIEDEYLKKLLTDGRIEDPK